MNQAVKKANKIISKKICSFEKECLLLQIVNKKADMSIIHLVLTPMNAYYKTGEFGAIPTTKK